MTPVNKILRGDCREVLRDLACGTADFALTDPPYVVRYTDRSGRRLQGDASTDWMNEAFTELYRVLKDDSYCVSFYGWSHAQHFLYAWRKAGFRLAGHFVWPKDYASSRGLVGYRHEQAYLLTKGDPPKPAIVLPDVLPWHYSGNGLHPTQKSVASLAPLVLAFSNPGELVLDPFCGSGSSLVAAHILGRRYLGVELDAEHAATASERMSRLPH